MIREIAHRQAKCLDRKSPAPERGVFDDLLLPELERLIEAVLAVIWRHIDDQNEFVGRAAGVCRRPADQKRPTLAKLRALPFGVRDRGIAGVKIIVIDRKVTVVPCGTW